MIIANFTNNQYACATGLCQYDYGQVLRIQGLKLPTAVEIHFGLEEKGGTTTTRIGVTKDGVTDVVIPDSMLENGDTRLDYTIYAFIYLTDDTSGKTVNRIKIKVKARSKPEQFDKPSDTELFYEAIKAVNKSSEEAEGWAHGREDMPERATDNAKYYAEQASGSAEEIKGVEQSVKEMVATIGGIEQQVQDVKEYAGQAKSASEKALLSEQEAKKSEEASLQHRTGAETAENNAELAEQNAKKSEQAVEQAKTLVMQMGQQVVDNKNHVDEKVEAFNKVVTDASDAINTKKTESLTEIKTAKTSSVGAVETAGTEQTKRVTDEGAKQVKAVEDKGQEVLQSIPQDFTTQMESKLNKQQGAENKGKALVVGDDGNVVIGEVQGGDGIPIINTMSGASPLVVPDSAERVNKGFSLLGKSEQVTTTGKNLFNYKEFVDPNTYDVKDSSYYRKYLQLKPNTKYTATVFDDIADDSLTGIFFIGSTVAHDSPQANGYITAFNTNGKHSVSFNTGEDGRLVMKVLSNATKLEEKFLRVDLIISEGNEIPYEPYTGGKPSPSSDYPQEIKNVGKWNAERQKYEVDIRVTGKNLVNTSVFEQGYLKSIDTGQKISLNTELAKSFTSNMNVEVIRGATVSISVKTKNKSGKKYVFADETDTIISGKWDAGNNSYSIFENIQIPQNACKLYFSVTYDVRENTELQIEIGSKITAFEPYREPQTLTITSDRPITKWDKLIERDGQIGWLYGGVKETIDGKTGRWAMQPASKIMYREDVKYAYVTPFCDKLPGYDYSKVGYKKDTGITINNLGILCITLPEEVELTLDAYKQYLADNPLHVLYKGDSEEFVPLTQSEQDAIRALKTYYTTTVIAVDGGEVIPSVEITYTADTKNYIDGKIANYHVMAQANQIAMMSLLPDETQATMIEKDQENLLGGI